jgi:hypothetical protein
MHIQYGYWYLLVPIRYPSFQCAGVRESKLAIVAGYFLELVFYSYMESEKDSLHKVYLATVDPRGPASPFVKIFINHVHKVKPKKAIKKEEQQTHHTVT